MATQGKKPRLPRDLLPQPKHFDEANVARLGLISIQERIPEGYASWEEEFEFLGKPVKLACYASEKVGGVPHGLDNEVSLALLALYFNAGAPEDGTFTTTPYQILKLMGLDTSGYYYQALKESLMRLTTATYVLSEAWRSGGRWQSVTFRYIEKLEYTSSPEGRLDRASVLRVTLAKEIVRSLKQNYVKPIDIEFMASLRRPLSRALYRLLDAQRFSPENPTPLARFEVNLMEWAAACKIVHKRPDKVRRTLAPAHEELIARRYLQSVEYVGRGQNQTIVYVFGEEAGGGAGHGGGGTPHGRGALLHLRLLPSPPLLSGPHQGAPGTLPGHPGLRV
jgi:plasmid replication initiation protein